MQYDEDTVKYVLGVITTTVVLTMFILVIGVFIGYGLKNSGTTTLVDKDGHTMEFQIYPKKIVVDTTGETKETE